MFILVSWLYLTDETELSFLPSCQTFKRRVVLWMILLRHALSARSVHAKIQGKLTYTVMYSTLHSTKLFIIKLSTNVNLSFES